MGHDTVGTSKEVVEISDIVGELYSETILPQETKTFWQKAGRTVNSILDLYFKPKSFEEDGKVYEKIGIKPFKKVVTGVVKKFKYPPFNFLGRKEFIETDWENNFSLWDKSVKGLRDFNVCAKISETFHIGFGACLAYSMASPISQGDIVDVVSNGVALLANTYCIILQRYNRARLYHTIYLMEARGR